MSDLKLYNQIDFMKHPYFLALIFPLLMISCEDPIFSGDDDSNSNNFSRTEVIYFPCNKFNGSDEWVYCTPVELDVSKLGDFVSAEMSYIMATTRGSSKMIAELYNLDDESSVYLSQVTYEVGLSVVLKQKSGDFLEHLPKEAKTFVIRFRNSENGPDGYINDYSSLILTYK